MNKLRSGRPKRGTHVRRVEHEGRFSVNSNLFYIAQNAAFPAKANLRDSLVAVVFSVIWLESFVNEAVEQVEFLESIGTPISAKLGTLVDVFGEAHQRTQLPKKIQLMSLLLTGEKVPTGTPPFQDLELLVRLRNNLVHLRVGKLTKKPNGRSFSLRDGQTLTNGLRQRGLITPEGDVLGFGWMDAIFNSAAAVWAFHTSVEMASVVAAMFPKGRIRRWVEEQIIDSPAFIRSQKRLKPVSRSVESS